MITAASAFKEPVHVFVGAKDTSKFASDVADIKGVDKVFASSHERLENPLADDLANISKGLIEKNGYKRVLAASTAIGKDFIPRLGGKIDS